MIHLTINKLHENHLLNFILFLNLNAANSFQLKLQELVEIPITSW